LLAKGYFFPSPLSLRELNKTEQRKRGKERDRGGGKERKVNGAEKDS
jgi:hypothetical protein